MDNRDKYYSTKCMSAHVIEIERIIRFKYDTQNISIFQYLTKCKKYFIRSRGKKIKFLHGNRNVSGHFQTKTFVFLDNISYFSVGERSTSTLVCTAASEMHDFNILDKLRLRFTYYLLLHCPPQIYKLCRLITTMQNKIH